MPPGPEDPGQEAHGDLPAREAAPDGAAGDEPAHGESGGDGGSTGGAPTGDPDDDGTGETAHTETAHSRDGAHRGGAHRAAHTEAAHTEAAAGAGREGPATPTGDAETSDSGRDGEQDDWPPSAIDEEFAAIIARFESDTVSTDDMGPRGPGRRDTRTGTGGSSRAARRPTAGRRR